jgi:ribosomal protein S18 acetylase RimI-like enzyme
MVNASSNVIVREVLYNDIPSIVDIYLESFKGMQDYNTVSKWVSLKFNSKPISIYYIALFDGKAIGYILWSEHGGFRKEAVIELEQIAVSKMYRGKGIASKLIVESLRMLNRDYITARGSRIKMVIVTTASNNSAKRLYERVLNAREVAVIKDLYSNDESILIARRDDVERIINSN